MATTGTTVVTRRPGKMNGGMRKKGRLAGLRARRRWQRHLQETISQPGSMTGITQRVHGGAAAFQDTVASTQGSTRDLDSKVGRRKRVGW
jgi:hypothetical protein